MDEWFTLFAAAVWRYLEGVGGAPAVAHSETQKLAAAWRALLRLHEADQRGTCSRCARGHRGNCTVWQVAIGYFVRRPS